MSTLRWHKTKDFLPECDRHVIATSGHGAEAIMRVTGLNTWVCYQRLVDPPEYWAYVIELGAIAP